MIKYDYCPGCYGCKKPCGKTKVILKYTDTNKNENNSTNNNLIEET